MKTILTLSDNVIARIVQIIQEGLIMGTDITDHMRMMKMEVGENDKLQLTDDYVKQVNEGYDKFNKEMSEKLNSQAGED